MYLCISEVDPGSKKPLLPHPKIPTKNPILKIAGYVITRYFHHSFFLYIYKNQKKKQIYPKK